VGKVVEPRDRAHAGCESGMRRHIGYSLAIEQHSTAIAETAHVVIAAADHITSSLTPLGQRPVFNLL